MSDSDSGDGLAQVPEAERAIYKRLGLDPRRAYSDEKRAAAIDCVFVSEIDGCTVAFVVDRPTIGEVSDYDRKRLSLRGTRKTSDELFADMMDFIAPRTRHVLNFQGFEANGSLEGAFRSYFTAPERQDWVYAIEGKIRASIYPQDGPSSGFG